jgi:alginate O-acetyltransferase complex protein AlgI
MIFSSPFFIFFLIFGLFFFAVIPTQHRTKFLLALSLLWYASWGSTFCLIFIAILLLNYVALVFEKKHQLRLHKYFYPSLIVANVVVFSLLKSLSYFNLPLETPLGLSFFYLMLLGMIIDQQRQKSSVTTSLTEFMLLPVFFPSLVGGPVLRGKNFFTQLPLLKNISSTNLIDGGLIFFIGYFKNFFLTPDLNYWTKYSFALGKVDFYMLFVGCFLSTFSAYVQLSSFCDMGRGAAKCFGLNLGFNFRPFYYSKSPNDFWARWNISLGEWLRDYISFPLMLAFGKKINQYALILFSFFLVGLWHGTTLNWFVFGLFNGLLVSGYSLIKNAFIVSYPKLVKASGYAMAFVLFFGNGLLVTEDFYKIFAKQTLFKAPAFTPTSLSLFAVLIGFLLVFEFFQERKNNLDFYLTLARPIKVLLIILIILFYFFLLHRAFYVEFNELPPLYFSL